MAKVRLGDVAVERKETSKNNQPFPTVGLEHLIPEEVTLTQWEENSDNTFTKIFRKGDVLFGRRRAYLKKAAIAPMDGICSGDITVISAKPDKIKPDLLPFVIQNDDFFDFAVEKSAGSLSPRAKWQHLKDYEFNLPDLDEQGRLAEILWAMQDTKRAYQNLLKRTDELVKSQFMEQIVGKYPEVLLGDEIATTSGGTPSRKRPEYYDGGTIPWLTSGEVNRGIIDSIKDYITQEGLDNSSAKWVPAGSVVIAMYGATAGTVGLLEVPTTTNQAVCALLPNEEYDPFYLYQAVSQKKEWMVASTNGAAQPNISQTIIKTMRITKPPMEIQHSFSEFVRQSDKSKFELENAIKELTATYKRIITESLGQ